MSNMLIPAEERTLSPEQVEALDRRRRRGHLLLVIGWQTLIVAVDASGVLLERAGGAGIGDMLCARDCAAARAE